MSKYEEYLSFAIHSAKAMDAVKKISSHIDDATKAGWTELYLLPDEDMLCLRGVKPPDIKAIQATKEKRRKQYERLKLEFGND